MAQPPISTLIVAAGDSASLRECLAVVREQAHPLASEVVVVLNTASEALPADDRRALLRLCDRLEFESTVGKSHALNRGVRACRGEVVAMTDEDARPQAGWLRSITEPLLQGDRAEGLVGCGGKVIPVFPEHGVPDWFKKLVASKPTSFLGPRHDLGDESGDYGPALPGGRAPIGANCAYLRSVLLRHPYDPALGPNRATGLLGGEDVELGRRLLSKGYRLRYLPDAEVQHPVRLERATLEYAMSGYFRQGVERVRTRRSLGLPTPAPSRLRARLWRNRLLCMSLCFLSPAQRIRFSLRGQLHRGMLAELDGRNAGAGKRERARGKCLGNAATGELEAQVGRLWQQIRPELGPVTERTQLFDADCRGRHLIALVDAIGRELGAHVVPAEVIASASVRDTASLVRRRICNGRAPLLVRLTPGKEGPPLVLLPGSDGTFVRFFEITRLLAEKRPCYGFEAQGVRPGERPHRSIRSLARRYATEIEREFGREPVVLVGLCLGGTVAHELARLLVERGTPPHCLVLGDTPCPTRAGTRRPWSSRRRRGRATLRDLRGWLRVAWDKTAGLEVRTNQIRLTYSLAALRHRPRRIETDTLLVTSEEFRRSYRCRDLGWAPFVQGGPKLVELRGGHFDVLRFQSSMMAGAIEEYLEGNALRNPLLDGLASHST